MHVQLNRILDSLAGGWWLVAGGWWLVARTTPGVASGCEVAVATMAHTTPLGEKGGLAKTEVLHEGGSKKAISKNMPK